MRAFKVGDRIFQNNNFRTKGTVISYDYLNYKIKWHNTNPAITTDHNCHYIELHCLLVIDYDNIWQSVLNED